MEIVLSMKEITKIFPGVRALEGVNFSCRQGEIHALLGENGAGKSTLIKILGGVYQPDDGVLHVGNMDEPIVFKSPVFAQKMGVNIVHQELNLIPYMTVAENIFLGQEKCNRLKCLNGKGMNRHAVEILTRLDSKIRPTDTVASLDSINQKMVQIAKALVNEPKILVVDEPTAALGAKEIDSFFSILKELKATGTTIIYISHLLEEIFEIADRVTILKDGKLIAVRNVSETSMEEVVRDMIGRELGELFPIKKSFGRREDKILSVSQLNRGKALKNISFSLSSGEVLGIAGLEGNGQNALVKTIFGANRKDSGSILVEGRKVAIKGPIDAINHGLCLVTDKRMAEGLCPDLSVRHNLMLPTLRKRQKFGFVMHSEESSLVKKNIREYRIKTSDERKSAKFLSGGNQQKIVIGKWLNGEPDIILLMEPTQGVDVGAKAEIYQLIRNLADEEKKAVVLVTGDMLELLGLCDRILVMRYGSIVQELIGSEISEENILRAAVGVV